MIHPSRPETLSLDNAISKVDRLSKDICKHLEIINTKVSNGDEYHYPRIALSNDVQDMMILLKAIDSHRIKILIGKRG